MLANEPTSVPADEFGLASIKTETFGVRLQEKFKTSYLKTKMVVIKNPPSFQSEMETRPSKKKVSDTKWS